MRTFLTGGLLLILKLSSQSQTCTVQIDKADTLICKGQSVQLVATGGTSYTWSPSKGLSSTTVSNPVATPLVSTSYVVTMTTSGGCIAKDSVFIGVQDCTIYANFSATPTQFNCPPEVITFNDLSTGNITYRKWVFGDGDTATGQVVNHTYTRVGTYAAMLVVGNSLRMDSVVRMISIKGPISSFEMALADSCSIFSRTYHFLNKSTGDSFVWDFGDGITSTEIAPSHQYLYNGTFMVSLIAKDSTGCAVKSLPQPLNIQTYKPIVHAAGALTLHATSECTDPDGWTNYFNDNGTRPVTGDDILLLSIKKNGNDIGSTGIGNFDVSVSATSGAGSNSGILLTNPLITNTSGFWVMNRYWQVKPETQPTAPVSVRFYFNTQDIADVNGSYPNHDLNYTDLLFYKTVGGSPDPTTNLQGASRIISLLNESIPDTSHWVYTALDTNRHMAEFMVSSFSGGGGGFTGNGSVLPLNKLSFSAHEQQQDVFIKWSMSDNIGIIKYAVEKSFNGSDFTEAYTLIVTDANKTAFAYADKGALRAGKSIYYRVKMYNKNGGFSYSEIEVIIPNKNHINISVSPNPARNFIIIHSSLSLDKPKLVLYDNLGRKVFTTFGINSINDGIVLPKLKNGLYHLVLLNKGQQVYKQNLMIQ